MDNDGNTIDDSDQLPPEYILDPVISDRPWGGVPFLYSSGDCHQLPPIGQKPFYSKEPASSTEGRGFRLLWNANMEQIYQRLINLQ